MDCIGVSGSVVSQSLACLTSWCNTYFGFFVWLCATFEESCKRIMQGSHLCVFSELGMEGPYAVGAVWKTWKKDLKWNPSIYCMMNSSILWVPTILKFCLWYELT